MMAVLTRRNRMDRGAAQGRPWLSVGFARNRLILLGRVGEAKLTAKAQTG